MLHFDANEVLVVDGEGQTDSWESATKIKDRCIIIPL